MVLAFDKFKRIDSLPTLAEKQKAWLEDYEGLNYSRAQGGKHFDKWATKPQRYDSNKFTTLINCAGRKKDRLVIEFDEVEGEPKNPKEAFEKVKSFLKQEGYGFIHSTHESKNSDYLWVEFKQNLTQAQAKQFLLWVCPEGARIDLNFSNDKKVFPVLFAPHWKYNHRYEMPIEYFEGQKIDFYSLKGISKEVRTVTEYSNDGFAYETNLPKEKTPVSRSLKVFTVKDLEKFKPNKNFLVQDFLKPQTITMLYSPPAQFKSLLAAQLSFCLANGVDFLGMKTKKSPVLYFDGENSQTILKERTQQIHKGLRLKRKTYPLYFSQSNLLMDTKKKVNLDLLIQIEDFIKEHKVKLIIFDTLHRFCLYDENSSDDLNKLYTQVFKPLADDLGVAVLFLHHSGKGKNSSYRGSGDFFGMVDVSYQVRRTPKTNEFTIINEKGRSGEIPEIKGEIVFGEEYIRFNKLSVEEQNDKKINKLKEVTLRIEELFDASSRLQRKDVISFLELQSFDYGSTKTVDRALKFLVESKKTLDKDSKGVYSLI